jgi:hypothetical protein
MWDTPRLLAGGVWCCDSDNFGVSVSPFSNNGGGVGCTPFGSPLASYEATAFVATNLATSCTTLVVVSSDGHSMTTTSTMIVPAGATYSGISTLGNATGMPVLTTAAPTLTVPAAAAAGGTGSAAGAALSPATIAGIAIGAVMAVVLLVLAIFVSLWCAKRRRLARNPPGPRELDGADHGRLPMGYHSAELREADSNVVHEMDAGVFNDMSHEGDKTNLFPEKAAVILAREKELQDIKDEESGTKGPDDYRAVYA